MVLWSALQWWEQWQLRVLILGSLLLQFFLHLSAYVRRLHVLRRLRALVWLAYVSSDALAIYALATLFNRRKQQQQQPTSAALDLEILWAPVLLIHLGGQPNISAYSLEDNELWKRHVITVLSQVTVAVYVFCKWWSGDDGGSLLMAAVLLFIIGVIKFGHKPWALKSATFNSMLQAAAASRRRREKGPIAAWWTRCTSFYVDVAGEEEEEGCSISLEEYVAQAKELVVASSDQEHEAMDEQTPTTPIIHPGYIYKMFVDLPAPYSGRASELRYFLKLGGHGAYDMLQQSLRYTFGLLYTKRRSTMTTFGVCVLILLPFLASNALLLFAVSDKDGYNENDVAVTYILLCSILVQEVAPYISLCLYKLLLAKYLVNWHGMVYQHSLLSFCARKKQPTILMKLATLSFLMESINKHWYVWQVPAARQITGLVRRHVKDGWRRYTAAGATYRGFSNLRGQRTLRKHHQLEKLGWSCLTVRFDRSVLIWHIATDLCFYCPQATPKGDATQRSREISNYMAYLLVIHPEMLMPGTRPSLFVAASDEIDLLLKDSHGAMLGEERRLAQEILDTVKPPSVVGTVIPDACKLAEALMELGSEQRWMVIQGVWMEMLCYSASRCRGYLHAKSLGEGGEYLSTVWLLWSFMGMETLADRHQRPECPQVVEEQEEKEEEEEAEETAESQDQDITDTSTSRSEVDHSAEDSPV